MTEDCHTSSVLEESGEKTTKEKIIDAATDIFAQRGFDAVSMYEIAEAVGIKKPSLYYHFASKDKILEKILEYPIERTKHMGPQQVGTEELIISMSLEEFMAMGADLIVSWSEEPRMQKTLRIIFVEMYHNAQIKDFYSKFIDLTFSFWEMIFTLMVKHKIIKPFDPKVLAKEYLSFYGNAYWDYFLLRYEPNTSSFQNEYKDMIDQHTAFIVNIIKNEGN
jgi:AcrR family transcriptional regulator